VMDRGYNDYAWFDQLSGNGVFFVTPEKQQVMIFDIRRYLDEINFLGPCHFERIARCHHAQLFSIGIDQADFARPDRFVNSLIFAADTSTFLLSVHVYRQ